jgi:feruloyl esterase
VAGEKLKSVMNANDPDLSRLQKRGAKMLMYFGWSDQALTPLDGVTYYENVARALGGTKKVQGFVRLFMVPGMTHCGGGPGANSFGQFGVSALKNDADHNIMDALVAWVETGRKPDRVIAAKYIDDDPKKGVAFTRPLCAYPQIALYKGSGSIRDASNFKCTLNASPN